MSKLKQYSDFIFEKYSRAPLYHALKFDYAVEALNKNSLAAHSFQRYWPGGKRLKDDDPAYEESYWYRGLSLTRDINYALGWGNIVFEFDQEALKNNYKVIPYNWGYSIGGGYKQGMRSKREREEFLITSKIERPLSGHEFIEERDRPGGYVKPLNKYLTGIYIPKRVMDIYGDEGNLEAHKHIQKIKSHPLYKGVK